MKKILLFSACVMFAFASCKKDSSKKTGSNTITATVGGSDINFSASASAQIVNQSGGYELAIVGLTSTGSNPQTMTISIASEVPIVKGTYTLNSSTPSDANSFPQLSYSENTSITNPVGFTTDITGANSSTITITSISSTNVQGTFSGVLLSDQDNTTTKAVTNGKFDVNIGTSK